MQSSLLDIPAAQMALGGISRSSIYKLISNQKLETVKVGRRVFLRRASVEQIAQHGA